MTERISSWDPKNFEARGIPTDNLINVYKRWGEGDIGLILTGNIMIEFDQLEAAGNPIIPRTEKPEGKRFEAFKRLASESKAHGSLIVGQVSHPGRQVESRIQKDPVSASDVQLEGNVMGMTFEKPHAASSEEIERIIEGFAHAAEYLHKAGYHGIELHGAQSACMIMLSLKNSANTLLAVTCSLNSSLLRPTNARTSMAVTSRIAPA